jgi:alpha-D-ribose 1-methylphosphonate 5-triphosphate diphosphatase
MNRLVPFPCPRDAFTIVNARAVTPEGLVAPAAVDVEAGRIVEIRQSNGHSGNEARLDAGGCLLLPGFVDIHADSLEMAIAPRPAAPFAPAAILPSYDAQLAMHGITTVFHCVGLADLGDVGKPLRTRTKAAEIIAALRDFAADALLRSRIHLRYEITDTDSLALVRGLVEDGLVDLVSLMDHTPGFGVFKDAAAYRDYHRRSGQTLAATDDSIAALLERRGRVDEAALGDLVQACHRMGLTVVSHDDHSAEKLEWALALGVAVAEFPVTLEAVDFARAHGMQTVFGTPNLIRGSSHAGNLEVAEMLLSNRVDILCLDYAPMCSLLALFRAVDLTGASLAEVSKLFSLNPAKAVGLDTLAGSIEPGKAADLILVDDRRDRPRVIATLVEGRVVYQTSPPVASC